MSNNKPKDFVWCIAYIDYSLIHKIPSDLKKSNQYRGIRFIIPTVRVLKKTQKSKDHFKEVPLLMNYGFFRIPVLWALNIDLLNKIKADVSCISNWVKDRSKGSKPERKYKKGKAPAPKSYPSDRDIPIATTTKKVINACCDLADELSIFSSEDIKRAKIGDVITLMIYPFDGMRAEIREINTQTKKIKVALADQYDETCEIYDREVEVNFDNVFYSIYQGSHNERYGEESLLEDFHINRRKPKETENEEV